MTLKKVFILLSFVLLVGSSASAESPIGKLNQIRESSGLSPLVVDPILNQAALSQANYLSLGNPADHLQIEGYPKYVGETPKDRALVAGWPTGLVYENFSMGERDSLSSLDELMSAIYHRNIFLKPELDRVGFAEVGEGEFSSYVYVLSSSLAAEACLATEENPQLCPEVDPLSPEEYRLASLEKLKTSPRWVGWPNKSLQVEPVFYDEVPDPLPDEEVSGYPISLEFNPALVPIAPDLTSFEVFTAEGKKIVPLLVMDEGSDPNERLGTHSFVFFPKYRLKWGESYDVVVKAKVAGRPLEVRWSFQTKQSAGTLVQIRGEGEWVRLDAKKLYSLYLPPDEDHPFFGDMEASEVEGLDVQMDFEDKNTLGFLGSSLDCARVHFSLSDSRTFHVLIGEPGGGTLFENPPVCYPKTLEGLRGYRLVSGLQLPINQGFFLLLPEEIALSNGFTWNFEPELQVEAKQVTENLLSVQVYGPAGGAVRLITAEGGEYNFMLSKTPSPFELFAPLKTTTP